MENPQIEGVSAWCVVTSMVEHTKPKNLLDGGGFPPPPPAPAAAASSSSAAAAAAMPAVNSPLLRAAFVRRFSVSADSGPQVKARCLLKVGRRRLPPRPLHARPSRRLFARPPLLLVEQPAARSSQSNPRQLKGRSPPAARRSTLVSCRLACAPRCSFQQPAARSPPKLKVPFTKSESSNGSDSSSGGGGRARASAAAPAGRRNHAV
jgi:hypothetical protein